MHNRGAFEGAGTPRRADLWVLVATLVIATALGAWAALPALAADEPTYGPQVVGGTSVPNGKYPFMASLQDETPIELTFLHERGERDGGAGGEE